MHKNIKHGFLQACINFGTLTFDMIMNILTPMCDAYDVDVPSDPSALKDFVKEIDASIMQYNQTLTFVKHPLVDEEFLVFGFTGESEVAKLSHFSEVDRHYFYKILQAMVNSPEYGITWSDIYNVESARSGQKAITKSHMQELVEGWTQQGYFLKKDSGIYFGPRMLVEYSNHLKINYPDVVKDCPLCSHLVLWDVTCSECATKMHRECIRKYLIRKTNCPSCNKPWNTRLSISES